MTIGNETLTAIADATGEGEMQEYTLKYWGRGDTSYYVELAVRYAKEMAQELMALRITAEVLADRLENYERDQVYELSGNAGQLNDKSTPGVVEFEQRYTPQQEALKEGRWA